MLKRLTHTGSTLRSRPVAEKAAIARALEEKVVPLLARGPLPAGDGFDASRSTRSSKAHARMDGGEHIGKIVLIP